MAENIPVESAPVVDEAELAKQARRQRWIMVGIIAGIILLLAAIAAAIFGLTRDAETTSNIRDIFIIFMAFESLIIGAALVILVIQVASLINLLQNEVKPILKATTDTVNNLRGTTEFLSENLVEPVIKLNSYLAGLRKFFDLFNLNKK
jgi:choline-glycine betaine transporter